jgi:ribose transport system substrate-binding protein
MTRRSRSLSTLAAVSMATVSLVATSGSVASASSSAKPAVALKSVDWANITDAGELQVQIQKSIVDAGNTLGVKVKLYNNNDDPTTALQNAQLMVTDHPSAVADFNDSIAANKSLGHIFNQAKLACVGVDISIPGCTWLELDNPALGTASGKVAAEAAKARGWTGANTTVIGITTWATGPFVQGAVTDFYSSFAKNLPGMEQKSASAFSPSTTRIGKDYVGLDAGLLPGPAFTMVQQVLPSLPKGQHLVVTGLNDDVVNSALKAIDTAGRSADAIAVGLGDGASINELRTNRAWVGEDDVFYKGWGETLLALEDGLVKGDKPGGPVVIPAAVVTKSNVDQYYGPTGDTVKHLPAVPSQDKYLEKLDILQKFGNFKGLK